MTWIIEWVYAILLTSLTGSILFIAWYLVGRGLEKIGFMNVVFELLKVVIVFFFLPVGYLVLKMEGHEVWKGYLFLETPMILTISRILLALWIGGCIFMMGRFFKNVKRCGGLLRNVVPGEREVVQLFDEIYREIGGRRRKPEICLSYYCSVPCATGIFRRKLILPMGSYSCEELRVIFAHEITHHLQGDVLLKWMCSFMLCIHFFNPMAWLFFRVIQKWSEFSCDYRACRVIGSLKKYFGVITDIAEESSFRTGLSSQLSESANELVERMEKMKKSSKVRFRSKWVATMMVVVAFVTSTVTVCAATVESAEQYVKLYHATEVEYEEVADTELPSDCDEYIEYGNAEGVVEREGEINNLTRSIIGFEWTIGVNELVKSDAFVSVTGQTINVSVFIEPSDVTVEVGLMQPDGSKRYVTGEGHIGHDFSINDSGVYRVFVENNSAESVEVEGSYKVY